MRNPLVAPELRELLQEGRADDLRAVLEDLHPNDAASIVSGLKTPEIVAVLEQLPVRLEADLFIYFDEELQDEIVQGQGRKRVKALLKAMPSDERYEFLDRVDDRIRRELEPLLEQAARNDLVRRERYEDDQVGALLSTEFVRLRPEMTVTDALDEVRRQEPNRETIYYSYVVDEHGHLLGFVSLRHLITARQHQTVGEVMKTGPVSIRASADQEEAARLIREYDLLALPVVTADGTLVGIVTHDDAADIEAEEVSEDIEKMAGLAGESEAEGGYGQEPVWSQIRRRVPLISFLAIFYVFTATVIAEQEQGLPGSMLLALLPMVMATGGMVGTQASSLVIRAITVGEVEPKKFLAVLWKEWRISAGLALILSVIVFGEGLLLGSFFDDHYVGDTHGLLLAGAALATAMAAHVISSALLGASVPLLAKAVGRDPALVSTPAVTAIADFMGAVIFFGVVLAFLALD